MSHDDQVSPRSFSSTAQMLSQKAGSDVSAAAADKVEDYSFFHSTKFKLCFASVCLNVVLFALDQFIITVAVPQIVNEFNSLDQVQWLNTAFFIPCAGAILIYTQIMTVVPPRWVYIASIVVFEVGSVVCGAANSMEMLIVGRAVAGLGGAGMYNATYFIGGEVIPFAKRPGYFGLFGVSYILASVLGPLVGGALTDSGKSGWRWCFYINLPIGGVTLALLIVTLPNVAKILPFDQVPDHRPLWKKLLTLDWISTVLTLGFVTCLGMGLQWGGISKPWNNAGVVVSLALSLALFIVLIGWNILLGPRAMIPMSLLRRRHFAAGIWVSFFGYGAIVPMMYYLPIYFEAIKNANATRAGVLLLGLQMTLCPFLIITAKVGERTGQSKIFILIGSGLVALGCGLLTLLEPSTSIAQVVGFEVILGVGFGMALNIMIVLVQADYLKEPHLVSHVTNVMNFWGFVGRIVAMSTGTSIFVNILQKDLADVHGLSPQIRSAITSSPIAIRDVVPPALLDQVLEVYNAAINEVWWLCLAFAIMILVSGLCMRNLNLRTLGEEAALAHEQRTGEYPMQPTPPISALAKDGERGFGSPLPIFKAEK